MYSVTRHEAIHAIVNGAFGRIPIWLNEGLAEYFERLSFKNGRTRIVRVSKTHLATLSSSQLPNLANYFNLRSEQWYFESRKKRHYALGWSLVYFLISSDHHKQFLRYMLDYLAFHYCEPFSDIAYINKHYPGGLKKFELNWKKWLLSPKRDHKY